MPQVSSPPCLSDNDPDSSVRPPLSDPDVAVPPRAAFWGFVLCVAAAVGYSVVNACLRHLAVDSDRVLVIFVKEAMTVVVVGPWLAWQAWRQGPAFMFPRGGVLIALAATGLLTHLGGNLPNLWAFSVIGMAVALPIMSGTNLAATAILGRLFLGERVSWQTMVAIGLLFVSVFLLCLAAPKATRAIRTDIAAADHASARDAAPETTGLNAPTGQNPGAAIESPAQVSAASSRRWAALAVAAACLAGLAYAMLVVVIRGTVKADTPTSAVVFIITVMAVVSLGPWLIVNRSPESLTHVRLPQLGLMIVAGLLNLLSFLAITKGLQWIAAAKANMIMTTQIVLGAAAGVAIFGEPATWWLCLGVCLTITGMILIGREVRIKPETPETPETPI